MMMPTSSMPACAIASMPKNSTGLLATGTSCLADVYVIGRSRVPRPPDRINPLSSPGKRGSLLRQGERQRQRRAPAPGRHGGDGAAVALGEPLGDVQAHARRMVLGERVGPELG